MASAQHATVLRQIHRLFTTGSAAGLTEGQLLDRFVAERDEAAFEALLARHGPMVLGLCRQILRDPHAADDAFQATFLILVRKAGTLRQKHLLGNWLFGVAYRVAVRARANQARRRSRERPTAEETAVEPCREADDLRPLVLEELGRLPEKYRAPVVLCYLQGQTHEAAAQHLSWPLGTVKGRLARARDLLRSRLLRRGVAAPAGALALELTREATAAVPSALVDSTLKAALVVAAGQTAAAGALSASVATLSEGVLRAMFLTKLKIAAAVALTAGLVATGAGVFAQQGGAGFGGRPADHVGERAAGPQGGQAGGAGAGVTGGTAALMDARLDAAKKTYEGALEEYKRNQLSPDAIYLWSCRWLDAALGKAASHDERVAAAQAHLERMIALEALEKGNWRGSQMAISALVFYRSEAEIWLGEEQAGRPTAQGLAGGRRPGTLNMQAAMARGDGAAYGPAMGAPMSGGAANSGPGMGMGMGMAMAGAFPGGAGRGGQAGAGTGAGSGQGQGQGSGIVGGYPAHGQAGGGGYGALGAMPPGDSSQDPKNGAILSKLQQSVPMHFAKATLNDVVTFLKSLPDGGKDGSITVYVDPIGLATAEETMQSPVNFELEGVPLRLSLRLLLRQLDLVYTVRDGLLIITSPDSDLLRERDGAPVRTKRGVQ